MKAFDASQPFPSGQATSEPALHAWRAFAFDLPALIATGTLRFAARRLMAQADQLAAITKCNSLSEAADLQSAFLTRAAAEYGSEAGTLMRDVQEAITAKAA